jgi:hypothetical protein
MTGSQRKREFLTVYDYGQGGVWTVLLATSEEEVASKYPELKIVTEPPGTMSQEELDDVRQRRWQVDIDDLEHPLLRALREGRN